MSDFYFRLARILREEIEAPGPVPSWVAQSPAALALWQADAAYRSACQQAQNSAWQQAIVRQAEEKEKKNAAIPDSDL
jgi:hypothetical protein